MSVRERRKKKHRYILFHYLCYCIMLFGNVFCKHNYIFQRVFSERCFRKENKDYWTVLQEHNGSVLLLNFICSVCFCDYILQAISEQTLFQYLFLVEVIKLSVQCLQWNYHPSLSNLKLLCLFQLSPSILWNWFWHLIADSDFRKELAIVHTVTCKGTNWVKVVK